MSDQILIEELFEQMGKIRHAVRQAAQETECLFQFPSQSLLDQLSFILDHPSSNVRAGYAGREIGMIRSDCVVNRAVRWNVSRNV